MKLFLCIIAIAFAPAHALAADGQVLINQSTVLATGGFPYKITQSGSYRLSGNLTVPVGVNAIVTANGVTLDLNGFSINGPGIFPNAGAAVFCTDHERITVTNGSVSGFAEGLLFLGNSRFIVLDKLLVNANTVTAGGQPIGGVSGIVGVNLASYALIRDSVFLGQLQLTCPGLIRDSAVNANENNLPPSTGGFDFPRVCTGSAVISAPLQ